MKRWLFCLAGALWTVAIAAGQAPPLPDLAGSEPQVAQKIRSAHARVESSDDDESWGRYAMILEAHRYTDEAEVAYRRAFEMDERDVRWPYLLGSMLEYFDPREARLWHERAIALDADYAPGRYRAGQTFEKLGRLDEAEQHFARAVQLDARLGLAHFGLGRVALARGDSNVAVRHLERAYELSSEVQAVVATLARAYHRVGRTDEARRLAAEARTLPRMTHHLDPRRSAMMDEAVSTESYLRRSRTYMEVGQLERSLRVLQTLLASQPDNHEAHFAAAGVLDRMGRTQEAVTAARRALELEPDLPGARAVLAGALFKGGDFAAARQEAEGVLRAEPNNFHMLLVTSMIAAGSGDTGTMVTRLDRAFEARDGDRELRGVLRGLLQDLADSFAAIGERAEAKKRLRWVRQLAVEEGAPSTALQQIDARLRQLEGAR
ncbi:MAG: tetratricopeptide repeat protein [Acidobacteriota bacterium]